MIYCKKVLISLMLCLFVLNSQATYAATASSTADKTINYIANGAYYITKYSLKGAWFITRKTAKGIVIISKSTYNGIKDAFDSDGSSQRIDSGSHNNDLVLPPPPEFID